MLLPKVEPTEKAEVLSYTEYRAFCTACHWSGEMWPQRKDANADKREHNKEFHRG